jgi:hypothetical protein
MHSCSQECGLASLLLLVTKLQCVKLAHVCLQNVCVLRIRRGAINDFRFCNCLYLNERMGFFFEEIKGFNQSGDHYYED